MDFIYQAIKKAEGQGKFESQIVPDLCDSPNLSPGVGVPATSHVDLLESLPANVATDLLEACENIRNVSLAKNYRIIGLTSPDSGAGTTTLVTLLAKMLACTPNNGAANGLGNHSAGGREYTCRVMVVDTQTREPVLHRLLGIDANPGLADAQRNGIRSNSLIREAGPNLDVITMGWVDHRSDITSLANYLGELLQRVREEYDFIVLDLLSLPNSPEGLVFYKLCEAVILVVHSGRSSHKSVQKACLLLRNAKIPIVGSLMNRSEYQIPKLISRWL